MYNYYSDICGCSSLKAFDFPGVEPLIHNDSLSNAENDLFVPRYFQNLSGFIDDMQPSESLETNPLLGVDDRITSALRKRGLVLRYPSLEDNKQLGEIFALGNGGYVSDFVLLKEDPDPIQIEFWNEHENTSKIWFKPLYHCENDVDILCELEGRARIINQLFRCIVLENVNSGQIEGTVHYSINKNKQGSESTGEILLFAVRSESHNKGYGNILLTTALSDITKHNCVKVSLESTFNPSALVTYIKFGFTPELKDQQKLEWKKLDLLNKARVVHLIGPDLTLDIADEEIQSNLQARKNLILEDDSKKRSNQSNLPALLDHIDERDLSEDILKIFESE